MNKKCARCDKTVYPIEELKCLDKVWHKQCFKCQSCGMTLNMRNYKGFNKNPYCEAHVPKAQATTMADTPELKRIQENTKLQSNVKYHAEFEKAKGKFTQVADDPEIKRIKQNSKIISNVAYHGDLERKAVMEQKRVLTGDNIAEDGARHEESAPYAQYSQPAAPPPSQMPPSQAMPPPSHPHLPPQHQPPQHQPPQHQHQPPQHQHQPPQHQHQPPQHQHQPPQHQPPQHQPPQHQPPHHQPPQHQPPQHQPPQQHSQMHSQQPQHYSHNQHHSQQPMLSTNFAHPGKIADYDPLNNATRNSPYSARQSSTLIYTSGRGPVSNQPGRRIGSIADLDPVNDFYGSLSTDYRPPSNNNVNHNNNHQTQQYHPPPPRSGRVYRAMYDYVAQDRDEVSFCDGDIIINCTPIDDGWMTGVVQRTGQSGMLPANYVEPAL